MERFAQNRALGPWIQGQVQRQRLDHHGGGVNFGPQGFDRVVFAHLDFLVLFRLLGKSGKESPDNRFFQTRCHRLQRHHTVLDHGRAQIGLEQPVAVARGGDFSLETQLAQPAQVQLLGDGRQGRCIGHQLEIGGLGLRQIGHAQAMSWQVCHKGRGFLSLNRRRSFCNRIKRQAMPIQEASTGGSHVEHGQNDQNCSHRRCIGRAGGVYGSVPEPWLCAAS